MKKLYILLCGATAALLMAACQGGKTAAADAEAGDTLEMKYAKLLTIVKHGDGEETSGAAEGVDYQYAEALIANPWKAGTMLHRYILIPKGEEGIRRWRCLPKGVARGRDALPIPCAHRWRGVPFSSLPIAS